MFKYAALAAVAATAFVAVPASAASVVCRPGNPAATATTSPCVVTLDSAGPGAVSSGIEFDVTGTGVFTAVFSFNNPFDPAVGAASASFNFDPDVIDFTDGAFSGPGSSFIRVMGPTGASIQVDIAALAAGSQTLTLNGTLTNPGGGNNFARIGGSITLTGGVVPEPATWALFILGFGGIGAAMRRRGKLSVASKAKLNFA